MSILVGVLKKQRTVVASDSLLTFGETQEPAGNVRETKLIRWGPNVIGYAGWGLYHNILNHWLTDSKPVRLDSTNAVFEFFLDLWKVMHEQYPMVNDQSTDKETPFGDLDASFIVATRGALFGVTGNLCVTQYHRHVVIGGGWKYASAIAHYLYNRKQNPRAIAEAAVQTAIEFDVYCGGDIQVMEPK